MSEYDNPYAPSLGPSLLPEEHLGQGELATRWERFAGAFIDGIIDLVVALPVGVAVGLGIGSSFGNGPVQNIVAQTLGGVVEIILFLAVQGYFLATRSQTIGKMALGTKIVADDGGTLPFGELYTKRYLILELVALIPFIGGFIGLVDVVMTSDRIVNACTMTSRGPRSSNSGTSHVHRRNLWKYSKARYCCDRRGLALCVPSEYDIDS
ncbi:MAG: RDD family protein [Pirellula sp.]